MLANPALEQETGLEIQKDSVHECRSFILAYTRLCCSSSMSVSHYLPQMRIAHSKGDLKRKKENTTCIFKIKKLLKWHEEQCAHK